MYAIWFNGTYRNPDSFSINLNDLGLLRGYGLFDYFRTYNRKPFQWDWYWNRFESSARRMELDKKIDKPMCREIVDTLIAQSPGEVAIRILLTGGFSENSIDASESNLFIAAEPLRLTPEIKYETGLCIESRDYMRDLPEIKTTDYKYLLLSKKNSTADDFIYCYNGYVYEMSRSNIFLVKSNTLITPDKGILEGISRKLVLELGAVHYAVEERPIKTEELFTADEVFTTSSTKQVIGITSINQQTISEGKPGKVTRNIKKLFEEFIEQHYFK
jgi:branched-chain amino acid aminotransferase